MTKSRRKNGVLSEKDFVLQAIRKLRKPPYKGIHSVFSGFNDAFRKYYDADPVAATNRLAEEGVIVVVPSRRGVTLYDAKDIPSVVRARPTKASDTLAKIIG